MSTPYWTDGQVTLHLGDCRNVLATLPAASVDAVITDPPYGLEFMGREWDSFKPSGARMRTRIDQRTNPAAGKSITTTPESYSAGQPFQHWCREWAAECLRVLKPGGHLLAFGGTRTWHRLACAIEDAGFEIRDSVADLTGIDGPGLLWLYAQGFPKSLNVSKDASFCQCDLGELTDGHGDLRGVRAAVSDLPEDTAPGEVAHLLAPVQREGAGPGLGDSWPQGLRSADAGKPGSLGDARGAQRRLEGRRDSQAPEGQLHGGSVRPLPAGVPADGAGGRLHHGAPARDGSVDRPPAHEGGSREPQGPRPVEQRPVESGAVPDKRGPQAGRGWLLCGRCGKPSLPRGLGTALKPAWEPIVVARKSLPGTVAANVLEHGTGALNVDGCRVNAGSRPLRVSDRRSGNNTYSDGLYGSLAAGETNAGRWPPNVLLGEEAAAELDRQSGMLRARGNTHPSRSGGGTGGSWSTAVVEADHGAGDAGGASRFFPVFRYEAKAASAERPRSEDGTAHPTVKPVGLIRWLCRLVTPPGGLVLDPFAGSGTTAEACIVEGFRCLLIEKDPAYVELIRTRLRKDIQPDMFGAGEAS